MYKKQSKKNKTALVCGSGDLCGLGFTHAHAEDGKVLMWINTKDWKEVVGSKGTTRSE